MADEKPPIPNPDKGISKEEFVRRDEDLTKALDDLEKKVSPPKPKAAGVGGMA